MTAKRSLFQLFALAVLTMGISCNEGNKKSPVEEDIQISEDSILEGDDKIRETKGSLLETEVENLIQITAPLPDSRISSPLEITGKARGPWYFEGDFPVRLFDANDQEIAVAIAVAQGAWMTEEWVDFEATMEFETPTTDTGYLEFQKSNPSDNRELDRFYRVKVEF